MSTMITKRTLLGAGLGLAAAACSKAAEEAPAKAPAPMDAMGSAVVEVPRRRAKTTRLFKAPEGMPNGLAIMTDGPGGLWIGEQKLSGYLAKMYNMPDPPNLAERAWLVDWNGKVIKTVDTPESRNTGGLAYGDGCLWRGVEFIGANGIYQTDMNGKLVSHRQVPLGPADNGGGVHGAMWVDGKLWVVANRLGGVLRIDPQTWTPEFFIQHPNNIPRFHDCAWDDGTIWVVTGDNSRRYVDSKPGLVRYNAATGEVMEYVDFEPGSCDPHALVMHEGSLISCDAGVHPQWPNRDSPHSGYIFRIDFI